MVTGHPAASVPSGQIVLATRNADKVRELRDILAPTLAQVRLEVVGLDAFQDLGDVVESGVTFAANALLKARFAARVTGLPALADDSGLAVDVLGGAPGVFSARWAGPLAELTGVTKDEANNRLLLAQLADVPDEHRGAGFVCAAALVMPGPTRGSTGQEVVREGYCRGVLAHEPRGSNGFGYDPLLVRPDGRTLAEHTPAEKDAVSHRGQAFRALGEDIVEILG